MVPKSNILQMLLVIPIALGLTSFIIVMVKYDDFSATDCDTARQLNTEFNSLNWANDLYQSLDEMPMYGANANLNNKSLIFDPIFHQMIDRFIDTYFTPDYLIEFRMGDVYFEIDDNITSVFFFTYFSEVLTYDGWVSYNRVANYSYIDQSQDIIALTARAYSLEVDINQISKTTPLIIFDGSIGLEAIVSYQNNKITDIKATYMSIDIDGGILLNGNYAI